jgi:hypothetical protein
MYGITLRNGAFNLLPHTSFPLAGFQLGGWPTVSGIGLAGHQFHGIIRRADMEGIRDEESNEGEECQILSEPRGWM